MTNVLFDRVIEVSFSCVSKLGDPKMLPGVHKKSITFTTKEKDEATGKVKTVKHSVGAKSGVDAVLARAGLTAEKEITATYKIPCDGPVKPAIHFTVSMLPQGHVHQAKVEITNFHLKKGVDLRKINVLTIKAGYRTGPIREFVCPVFSAYTTSPTPGGVTVFNCLTVGSYGALSTLPGDYKFEFNYPYMIKDNKGNVISTDERKGTYRGLVIGDILSNLGFKYEFKGFPDGFLSQVTGVVKTFQGSTMLALLEDLDEWIQAEADEWNKQTERAARNILQTDPNTSIAVRKLTVAYVLDDDKVTFVGNFMKSTDLIQENGIILDLIRSATFTGEMLTVIAPYNPLMTPGKFFQMSPVFYSGDMLPNALSSKNLTMGYFRAITVNIDFDTTGSHNSMTVLARPAWEEVETARATKALTIQDAIKATSSIKSPALHMRFGYTEAEEILDKNVWNITLFNSYMSNCEDYIIKKGDTLSEIAKKKWGSKVFKRSDLKIKEGATGLPNADEIPIYYFFPVIMFTTYQKYRQTKNPVYEYNDATEEGRALLNNPDRIQYAEEGTTHYLSIPEWSLTDCYKLLGNDVARDMFLSMAAFYRTDNKGPFADMFESIAWYIQWGER